MDNINDQYLNLIIKLIYDSYEIDFFKYKKNTILRRLKRRMEILDINNYKEYYELLLINQEELTELCYGFLIGMTKFFRDINVFSEIENTILYDLLIDRKKKHLKIWIAACSTGEEVYSYAILIKEFLNKYDIDTQVHIIATDINNKSIDYAREGIYNDSKIKDLSKEYISRYFIKYLQGYKVKKEIRDMISFAQHDLLLHPPLNNIDIISCRNVLIYLKSEYQNKILSLLNFSLCNGGYLILGKGESIVGELLKFYKTISNNYKIYQISKKIKPIYLSNYKFSNKKYNMKQNEKYNFNNPGIDPFMDELSFKETEIFRRIIETMFSSFIIINENFDIVYIKGEVRKYLKFQEGYSTNNFFSLLENNIRGLLIKAIEDSKKRKEAINISNIVFEKEKKHVVVDVQVIANFIENKESKAHLIRFNKKKKIKGICAKKYRQLTTNKIIKDLEEEIVYIRRELQATIQELEIYNEELQVTSEELITTNAELESTNEELQCSNEELNASYKSLEDLNLEINNIFSTTNIATIFLDKELKIRKFTPLIKKYFNVTESDTGKLINHFSSTFDEDVRKNIILDAQRILLGQKIIEKEVITLKQDYFLIKSTPFLLADNSINGVVISFVNITNIKKVENKLKESENKFSLLFNNMQSAFSLRKMVYDDKGKAIDYIFIENNPTFDKLTGYNKEILGKSVKEVRPEYEEYLIENYGKVAKSGKPIFFNKYIKRTQKYFKVVAFSPQKNYVAVIFNDITKERSTELKLKNNEKQLNIALKTAKLSTFDINIETGEASYGAIIYKQLGYQEEEIFHSIDYFAKLLHPEDYKTFIKRVAEINKNIALNDFYFEYRLKNLQGNWVWIQSRGQIIRNENNRAYRFSGISMNIDIEKKKQEKIEYLATHDVMTGLYNRNYFERKIVDKDFKYPVSIIICDIDGVKLINDSLGHQYGDDILKKFASILKNNLCNNSVAIRIGGDEFAIVVYNVNIGNIDECINKIKEEFKLDTVNYPIRPSVSIGYYIIYDSNVSFEHAFKEAEDSMYRQKLLEHSSRRSGMLESLKMSLNEKTHETQLHCERIEDLAVKIAEVMNLNNRKLSDLRLLSMLHDIGKISTPDNILNKPGHLDKDEWETMKKHCEIGYRIASNIKEIEGISKGILSHHERWDGKGYPQGLKKEEIPLLSRIIAVADTYDAMTNDRSYRKGKSHIEAVEEIKNNAGKQFDPEVVKAFLVITEK